MTPRRVAALLMLLAAPLAFRAGNRAVNAGTVLVSALATGSIDGEVTLPKDAGGRTADRYMSSTGQPKDIQAIPPVVYVDGPIASAPPARASGPLELVQRGEAFQPQILVVPVGAQVKFPNGDPLFHNVFSYSRPKRFDLGRYRQGESKTVVFDHAGYVKVLCEVHQWMRAAILVVENPYYAIVPESGRFRIDAVPPGHYRVAIEHFDRRVQVEVDVPDGGAGHINVKL